ncbi:hypothetical protein HN873_014931, partial [Arachis hypogaea]
FLDWCPEGRDVVDFSLAASSGGHLITYNLCTISFLSRLENKWWPTELALWYSSWRNRFEPLQ